MHCSLVFFGGCTGIGKSKILESALKAAFPEKQNEYEVIKISSIFEECRTETSQSKSNEIHWYRENWKEFDKKVCNKLKQRISNSGEKLIIINQHFATISPFGYIPGIDLDTLDELLEQHIALNSSSKKQSNEKCNFGVLLIDTGPKCMRKHYDDVVKKDDKSILGYISDEHILKDLEENRMWAAIYSNRALAVLNKANVVSDAVYVYDPDKLGDPIEEVTEFFKKFKRN